MGEGGGGWAPGVMGGGAGAGSWDYTQINYQKIKISSAVKKDQVQQIQKRNNRKINEI